MTKKSDVPEIDEHQRETVKALIKRGASMSYCVDILIATSQIGNLIRYAQSGDTASAKELLGIASAYLNPHTEMFGPMPSSLREYLWNAFGKISLGESADVTLNLMRNGRPRRSSRSKLVIAHWIYKEMQKGKSLQDASGACEKFFEAKIKAHGVVLGYDKIPNSETLEGIYSKALPEIKRLYWNVQQIESALKT